MAKRVHVSMVGLMLLLLVALSANAFAGSILVKEGSRGDAVRHVQTLLIEQGWLADTADGVCGPKTVETIRRFQKEKGLPVDGVCGDGTYAALTGGKTYQPPRAERASRGSGRVIYMNATAYSALDPGNGKHTSTGTLVRRGVIAVDPSVIPLGTHVFIPGYGEAVAEDVGWGIKGNRIDVAFDTHEEALAFGRRDLEVYILE